MGDLQARIAEIIDDHSSSGAEGQVDCWCDERFLTYADHAAHVAGVLTEQLGLREEHYRSAACPDDQDWDRWRVVTEWREP